MNAVSKVEPGFAVYRAILGVAADLSREGIAKERQNVQQKYAFRGIDDVMNALSGLLVRHRLVILPTVMEREQTERKTAAGGNLFYTTVRMQFTLLSADDGSSHSVVVYGEGMDSADKSTNKAQSAAYKYMAFQTFCIPTEGMEDADMHTPPPTVNAKVTPNKSIPARIDTSPEAALSDAKTVGEFLQALELALDAASRDSVEAVNAVVSNPRVVKSMTALKNGNLEKLRELIATAQAEAMETERQQRA